MSTPPIALSQTPAPPAVAPARGGLSTEIVRGAMLLALGGMLLFKVANGTVVYYVKEDLAWLVLAAGVGLLLIGAAYLLRWAVARPAAAGWRATLLEAVMLAPLLAGLALPAQPLDSASLAQRGLNTLAGLPSVDERLAALQSDTSQWTLLDWSMALQREADPSRLHGKPVSLVGFVYPDDKTLQPGEFTVARFVVTCCAADGAAVGLPVRTSEESVLKRDTWVRVDGTLDVTAGPNGEARAVVVPTSVQPIEVPRNPYLYP